VFIYGSFRVYLIFLKGFVLSLFRVGLGLV